MLFLSLKSGKDIWHDKLLNVLLLVLGTIPLLVSLYELNTIDRVSNTNYLNEVLNIKFKGSISKNSIKSGVKSFLIILVVGVTQLDMIDNVVLLGGSVIGGFVAMVTVRTRDNSIPIEPNILTKSLGLFSAFILIVGVVIVVSVLY